MNLCYDDMVINIIILENDTQKTMRLKTLLLYFMLCLLVHIHAGNGENIAEGDDEEHDAEGDNEEHDAEGDNEEHDAEGDNEEHDAEGDNEEHDADGAAKFIADYDPNLTLDAYAESYSQILKDKFFIIELETYVDPQNAEEAIKREILRLEHLYQSKWAKEFLELYYANSIPVPYDLKLTNGHFLTFCADEIVKTLCAIIGSESASSYSPLTYYTFQETAANLT
ncbi:unnamed protein product [Trichobilharzia szidati]|nr:unnamed protein product [Trichobilharzia szidati]